MLVPVCLVPLAPQLSTMPVPLRVRPWTATPEWYWCVCMCVHMCVASLSACPSACPSFFSLALALYLSLFPCHRSSPPLSPPLPPHVLLPASTQDTSPLL